MGNIFKSNDQQIRPADHQNQTTQNSQNSPDSSIGIDHTRAQILFEQMDQDGDGRADYGDFKRSVLNDAEIIQGLLVYDGVI